MNELKELVDGLDRIEKAIDKTITIIQGDTAIISKCECGRTCQIDDFTGLCIYTNEFNRFYGFSGYDEE